MMRDCFFSDGDATRSCRFALRTRRSGLASERSGPRPDQTICKLVHGRDRSRNSRCQRDEPRHGRPGRQTISSDCSVKGFRSGRVRLFHELRKRKRKTAQSQSLCGAGFLLDRAGPANSHQREGGKNLAGRIANLFSFAPARQPAERVGLAPKRGLGWAARLGRANGRDGRTFWERAYSVAATLGWISSETQFGGILAGTPESFARPLSLYTAGRSSLADRTARALN